MIRSVQKEEDVQRILPGFSPRRVKQKRQDQEEGDVGAPVGECFRPAEGPHKKVIRDHSQSEQANQESDGAFGGHSPRLEESLNRFDLRLELHIFDVRQDFGFTGLAGQQIGFFGRHGFFSLREVQNQSRDQGFPA